MPATSATDACVTSLCCVCEGIIPRQMNKQPAHPFLSFLPFSAPNTLEHGPASTVISPSTYVAHPIAVSHFYQPSLCLRGTAYVNCLVGSSKPLWNCKDCVASTPCTLYLHLTIAEVRVSRQLNLSSSRYSGLPCFSHVIFPFPCALARGLTASFGAWGLIGSMYFASNENWALNFDVGIWNSYCSERTTWCFVIY